MASENSLPASRGASRRFVAAIGLAAAALTIPSRDAAAQAWFYPSFQTPTTVEREYNFAVVGASGADLLFQWREGIAPGRQLSLDAGLADPSGSSNTRMFVGGQFAQSLTQSTAQQPIDVLFTVGAGFSFGSGAALLRIPAGVSLGHTFPLEGGMAVTPYVHPRASLDVWSSGDGGNHLSLDFDIGANLAITPTLALRGAVIVSGNDASSTGFGLGLTITPSALRAKK